MAQPPQIAFVEGAQIRDAVLEHRQTLHAHAERETLPYGRIKPAIGQNARMDHARPQDFEPIAPFPDLAGLAGPADIDFHGGLGEGEIGSAETYREMRLVEKNAQEFDEAAFEVAESDVFIDHQPFALVEHRRMGGVMIRAIGAARRDNANRRLLGEHGANLHAGGLSAQYALYLAILTGGR